MYIVLALIGLLWLVPTIGLFFTSLLAAVRRSGRPAGGRSSRSRAWRRSTTTARSSTTRRSRRRSGRRSGSRSAATFLPIVVASLAAYAFAWLEFPGRDWLFLVVVALLVVPDPDGADPDLLALQRPRALRHDPGLVLFHTAFGLPFAIFLLRNFFIGIPRDLLEAARIDGASEFRIFFRVVLPLGLPAIASLAIFQFLWVWNDLLVALTFARDTQPITVAIFSQMRQFSSNIELIAPAAFISLAIPLVVFFAFQRYFVQGLLAGSVK